jgi:LmbE family N-acetylglucosaminyl deacetylase
MQSPEVWSPEPGRGRVVLVVAPHADDTALFIGGTVARWTAAGWRVILVRVTDDRWDSIGIDEAETIRRHAQEVRRAAATLGISDVIDLGWPTDTLADISENALREQIIRQIRTHKPYALVTFDQYSMYGEDNQDHKVVAAAVDEAFWTSQFDKHHPEHIAAGLLPHGAFERWYFGRRVTEVTHVVDISTVLATKIEAALCHETPLRNFVNQLRLQASTGGWRIPALDAIHSEDGIDTLRAVMQAFLTASCEKTGKPHGLGAAEEFRVVSFGGMEALLDMMGEPL